MTRQFTFWLILFLGPSLLAQDSDTTTFLIKIHPYFGGQPLQINEEVEEVKKVPSIETLRFYLSKIRLIDEGAYVWEESNSYHLIDALEHESLTLTLKIPARIKFDQLDFQLGIDSLTNAAGVMGGDLDPTKGMYWSWNTGYINFKLEGKSTECPSRGQAFQFHLGGYLPPYNCVQSLHFDITRQDYINLKVDISQILNALDLSEQYRIMSPSEASVQLSTIAAKAFSNDTKE